MDGLQRKRTVVLHEGQILAFAGNQGEAYASDLARCVADGALNAIIRLEGREAAAGFAFVLADRVAGGVREPTGFVFVQEVESGEEDDPDDDDDPSDDGFLEQQRRRLALAFAAGVTVGSLIVAVVSLL